MDLSKTAEDRIYVVVAETVQTPLLPTSGSLLRGFTTVYAPTPDTRHIVQPAGRMAAQAAHAVSKVRVAMVEMKVHKAIQECCLRRPQVIRLAEDLKFYPITTIVLAARDSFELGHVLNLLFQARISVEEFEDINPEAYGPGPVRTAIATWPMQPREVVGILDYLPLAMKTNHSSTRTPRSKRSPRSWNNGPQNR